MPTTIPTTTSSTRPGSPSAGDAYFETDTKNYIIYDGANWRGYVSDGLSGWSGSNTYSLNFDGTDDYLTTSTVVTPSATSGTISAWIKIPTSAGSALSPIMSWTDININTTTVKPMFVYRQGKLRFYFQDGATTHIVEGSSTGLNDNVWHHVAVTSDGSSYSIYLDGSAEILTVISGSNSGDWVGDISGGTLSDTDIGASRRNPIVGGSAYAVGNIDEVAVWDSALSSSQISTIYNSGTPGNLLSLSPKAWWRMGDGAEANSGTTIYDMSSFSNNMTMVSSPAYQSDTP
jgi:hypothetical protein